MKAFIWLLVIVLLVIGGVLLFRTHPSVTDSAPPVAAPVSIDPKSAASAPAPQPTPAQQSTTTKTITTKDGMKIETITPGTGPEIKAGQTAVVQYEGKLANGSVFDSTAKHGGTPFKFNLGAGQVIKGWDEGVLGMKVGETRMLTIPPELGYGPNGYPPIIPANATLTFTVTLQGIE